MYDRGDAQVQVAVALVTNRNDHVLLIFNDRWGTFNLPMTKRRRGRLANEPMSRAAVRAAAEALGVPVRRVEEEHSQLAARLQSGRQLSVKSYAYDVYHLEPHPDFAARVQIRQPHLWLSPHLILSGAYEPISESTRTILRAVLADFEIPARIQHTSVLVLQRDDPERGRQFLLRRNRDWGYALPAKRWEPSQSDTDMDQAPAALAAAQRVAREELGLEPQVDVALAPARDPEFTTHGVSPRKGTPAHGAETDYRHRLFTGALLHPEKLRSRAALAWVTEEEVHYHWTAASQGGSDTAADQPGRISRTTYEILLHQGLIAEVVDPGLAEDARNWLAQHGGGKGAEKA
jgi:8-oxo-dGTP pyrophosphatase MutT (NUDIX family)